MTQIKCHPRARHSLHKAVCDALPHFREKGMKKKGMKQLVLAVLSALTASLIAVPGRATSPSAPLSDEASVARGARLYEDWAHESREREEVLPNPAFKSKNGRVDPADTWRCVTCHGWDYKGMYGFPGIRKRAGGKPEEVVALLKTAPHDFVGRMNESDFVDLANFVTHGQVDMEPLILSARQLGSGAAAFENIFATTCANCHGLDGGRKRSIRQLGETAREQPSKVLHVVLNGHAGGNMPALRAFGTSMAVGMLAYARTLPGQNLAASITNGGRLYDDWQWATGGRQALPHPAYPKNARYADVPQLTWRCRECHGPDYKGSEGVYATGEHATGIKGIRAMAGADPADIMRVLRNRTHRFGAVLKYRDLQDLANFVSQGQVDMDVYIDPKTGLARGVAERGEAYFQTICAGCHGLQGRFTAKRLLGNRARKDPWASLHSMLNGHPDDNMPALREIDQKVIKDILAYVQTLKVQR
jgi:mono/diheme cytochrome c family protein